MNIMCCLSLCKYNVKFNTKQVFFSYKYLNKLLFLFDVSGVS